MMEQRKLLTDSEVSLGRACQQETTSYITLALLQSSSVLAHRHHKTSDLTLPVSDEDEISLKSAFEGSLGNELNDR